MEKNKFIMPEKLPYVKDLSPNKIIPNLETVVPKDFDMEKYLDIMEKTGIMLVESRVTLIEVNSNVKITVSKSVIDWLEMHDVEYIGGIKHYIVGNLKYKIDGED